MSYIKTALNKQEKIIVFERLHWITFFYPGLLMLFLLYMGFYFMFLSTDLSISGLLIHLIGGPNFLGGGCFLAGAVVFIKILIKYLTTETAVTNKRVVFKTGFIKTYTNELMNEKLENIQIKQSLLGKLLGYGDLKFIGAGGSPVVFKDINNPILVKKQIEDFLF